MTISRTTKRAILATALVALVVGAIILWRSGVVTPSSVKAWLDSLGAGAPVLFVAVFVVGSLLGIMPGMAMVIGGRLAFGPWLGFAVGFGGGLLAVTVPFALTRWLRRPGTEPWRPSHPRLARAFAMLETHPFRVVLALRLVLWFNAPLSYAMAFAPVRSRTYVAACALAIAPLVALAMIATSWFL